PAGYRDIVHYIIAVPVVPGPAGLRSSGSAAKVGSSILVKENTVCCGRIQRTLGSIKPCAGRQAPQRNAEAGNIFAYGHSAGGPAVAAPVQGSAVRKIAGVIDIKHIVHKAGKADLEGLDLGTVGP